MSQNNTYNDDHTTDFKKVLRTEEEYIKQRRRRVHITEGEAAEGTWGIAFSNGGARASTLMLGVLRKLMSEGVDFFRRIDYLSAVGGSSFMASTFTSLLTGQKSADKRGLFGTRPHNSPFLPETNTARTTGKGVKPDVQMAHFRKRIKDICPQFWKHIGKTPGLFGIGASGMAYAFAILMLVMITFMSLHHAYFYWISHYSGDLFQQFIDTHKIRNFRDWGSILNLFDFSSGVAIMVKDVVKAALAPSGLWIGGITAVFGAIMSFNFFVLYLRPILQMKRSYDVHIEITIQEFNYFGFGLTYLSLLIFGIALHMFDRALDYRLAFAVPVFLTFGILICGLAYSFFNRLQYANDDNRRIFMAEILTAALGMFFVSIAFPVLLIVILLIGGWLTLFASMIYFFIGTVLVFRRIRQLGSIKAYRRFGNSLPNFFIGFSIVLLFASAGKIILELARTGESEYQFWWFVVGVIVPISLLYVFSLFNKENKYNLHSYFKNRKSEIFLITDTNNLKYPARDDSQLLLHGLGANNYYAPYLLLNATLNVHNSAPPNTRGKRGVNFYFSKDYVGSEKTGYVRTEAFEDGKFTLADAMMTAAANYHSGMGVHGFYGQAFLFTLFNLRLGTWLRNPWYYRNKAEHPRGSSHFINFLREFVNRFSTRALHINVSSGIHTGDHWGLTALLRRQCDNIILCDFRSPADLIPGELNMTDIRAIAAKYGASIGDAKIAPLQKREINGRELCESNVISCSLTYQSGGKQGTLYYIKLAMSEALPESILEYHDSHPEFPFKFISDLQSSDLQFTAFVQLGEQLAEQFYDLYKKNDADSFKKEIEGLIHKLNEKERIETLKHSDLQETKQIYIEKLNFYLQERAITSDAAKKFELSKEIEQIEVEIDNIRNLIKHSELGNTLYQLSLNEEIPLFLPDEYSTTFMPSTEWIEEFKQFKGNLSWYQKQSNIGLKIEAFEDFRVTLTNFSDKTRSEPSSWNHYYFDALKKWQRMADDERVKLEQEARLIEPITPNIYNPGDVLTPQIDGDIFLGRRDLVEELQFKIGRSGSIPMLLIRGQRRVGKTSLLRFLPDLLGSRFRVITQDLQSEVGNDVISWLKDLRHRINEGFRHQRGGGVAAARRLDNSVDGTQHLSGGSKQGIRLQNHPCI